MKNPIRFQRAKIVATLGPSTSSKTVLKKLFAAGVDVVRLNFAHGTHEEHAKRIKLIRETAKEVGVPIGILMDLPGPKIRVGKLAGDTVDLRRDDIVHLAHASRGTTGKTIPISYRRLADDLRPGQSVYIADGLVRLIVQSVGRDHVRCRVTHSGTIRSGNGVNMPHSALTLNAFTAEDRKHLNFGLKHGIDFVGISFAGKKNDIEQVRAFCRRRRAAPFLIAKIERRMAVDNLTSIVKAADGLMVARGDLGVEVPFAEIPGLQETIVAAARQEGKPVIVATQVLESMIQSPRPTRAEATDIANAIMEGADAVMLSGETAAGKFPLESVQALRDVIEATERGRRRFNRREEPPEVGLSDVVAFEACHIADRIKARFIVVPTRSGSSAARVSRFRPSTPILAWTSHVSLRRRFSLYWGVSTCPVNGQLGGPNRLAAVKSLLLKRRLARRGDTVVLVGGDPAALANNISLVQAFEI